MPDVVANWTKRICSMAHSSQVVVPRFSMCFICKKIENSANFVNWTRCLSCYESFVHSCRPRIVVICTTFAMGSIFCRILNFSDRPTILNFFERNSMIELINNNFDKNCHFMSRFFPHLVLHFAWIWENLYQKPITIPRSLSLSDQKLFNFFLRNNLENWVFFASSEKFRELL